MLIVKVGGGENINWEYICSDIAELQKKEKIVLVHGANAKRDEVAKKIGIKTRYLISPSGQKSVYTDRQALEVLTMVYAGLVNKQIVANLKRYEVNAIGLSGADARIWEGRRKKNLLSVESGKTKLVKDTFTGKVEKVNSRFLNLLLDNRYLPVLTQPAISYEGELINTDNDRNLAVMAGALGAKEIVSLFEAPGLLEKVDDETSLIKNLNKRDLDKVMKKVDGRMRKKVLGAIEAFEFGVEKIYWGDGRIKKPISRVLSGKGTEIS